MRRCKNANSAFPVYPSSYLIYVVAGLMMAGTLLLGPPESYSAVGSAAAARRPVTTYAPCSGRAEVEVRLKRSADDEEDFIVIVVDEARPLSWWHVEYQDWAGDSGDVVSGKFRADADGHWRVPNELSDEGRHEIDVEARSRLGQECAIGLEANLPGF